MAGSAKYHDEEALRLTATAEGSIARALEADVSPERMHAVVLIAQASATLALAHRTAEQTATLADLFGDDSHLDSLKREVRDGFEAIRVDGIGVG